MQPEAPPSFSFRHRWSGGVNALVAALAALAVLVMLNYLAARHYLRASWTADARAQLSARTRQVLGLLTNDLKVFVYFDTKDSELFSEVNGLLKEYRFLCPRLQVEVVDYYRDIGPAREIKARYGLSQLSDKDMVIFDNNGRTKIVTSGELSEYDVSQVVQQRSKEVRRTHFKGEMLFTSALFSITSARTYKAYFLTGHREWNPDLRDRAGYAKFANIVSNECNIQWEKLSLAVGAGIPEDCNLLIIAGPVDPLVPTELDRLQRYLEQGGRLLVLLSFRSVEKGRPTGLEKLLANWDIAVGQNIVRDDDNNIANSTVIPVELGNHPIVNPLRASQVFLYQPRSIGRAKTGGAREDAIKVEELLRTGPKSEAISEWDSGLPVISSVDRRGSFTLMVAAEKGAVPGVASERGATRLVVVGDDICLKNDMIENGANRDLGAHVVNWLVDQNVLLTGLAPRPVRSYKLMMTEWQMAAVTWILLLGVPGGVAVLGGLVWWRRRS